ncbi:MAG: hypothetical protein ACI85U_003498, partial [Candidatus Promineifilaceae bacterium]
KSGDSAAIINAIASSVPVSTSRITFLVIIFSFASRG